MTMPDDPPRREDIEAVLADESLTLEQKVEKVEQMISRAVDYAVWEEAMGEDL